MRNDLNSISKERGEGVLRSCALPRLSSHGGAPSRVIATNFREELEHGRPVSRKDMLNH